MAKYEILIALGENIFNRIIEDTNPGDEFLLSLIDPDTFDKLKEKTMDTQEVENALKLTGRLKKVDGLDDYALITAATLQVILIYSETNITDDSFYSRVKSYYPNLNDDSDVQRYFRSIQEPLWKKVKDAFKRAQRELHIPEPKTGPGRYVQFPKSQQLIRWSELVDYADEFIKIKLKPGKILSLDDFCDRVHISHYENEIIRRIVFSFYNKWDGRPTDEIRTQRNKPRYMTAEKPSRNHSVPELTISLNNETVSIFIDGCKTSENELLGNFADKPVIAFLFNEDYEDWVYTTRMLHTDDKLLVLTNKYLYKTSLDNFRNNEYEDIKMKHFRIFRFESCNNEIARLFALNFDKNNIYTIIGGITATGHHHLPNNVLGVWYDFALPWIKINLSSRIKLFIDSKETVIDKNQVDLSSIVLKETGQKYALEPGKHSFKCTDVSPAYFSIQESKPNTGAAINQGWVISTNELRPVKKGEKPHLIGLMVKPHYMSQNANMRPFLSGIDHFQNRFLESTLNAKIQMLERRKTYGC